MCSSDLKAIALALARAGASVIVCGRDSARGDEVVRRIQGFGGMASFLACDVGRIEQVEGFAKEVDRLHGPVDILVNSAGLFLGTDAVHELASDLQLMWEVNVSGLFAMCQEFGRRMLARSRGKIINLTSVSGLQGYPGSASYSATKGAVVQLTKVLAVEWARSGVNVNAIAPCDFVTPMTADYLADADYLARTDRTIPVGRPGRPEDLAGAVIYLASAASDMVAGHTLAVDGGSIVNGG